MSMPRSLVIAAALAALLVTSLAVPVAAAKTKLAIVNGIPGKTVDVCVNGREVKSGLRYGRFVFRNTRTAKATVKFYKRDPRRCGGKLLAKRTTGIDDATLAVTRRHPLKVVVFDNAFLAAPLSQDGDERHSLRHAADLGGVTFHRQSTLVDPDPIVLSVDDAVKGQKEDIEWLTEVTTVSGDEVNLFVKVTKGGTRVVRSFAHVTVPDTRFESILVGTVPGNARWVFISRKATPAT